jgi:hypothetical protein
MVNHSIIYTYVLNNPLKYIDPSGYYNKPTPLERERSKGGYSYYNPYFSITNPQLSGNYHTNYNPGSGFGGSIATGTHFDWKTGGTQVVYMDVASGRSYYKQMTGSYVIDDGTDFWVHAIWGPDVYLENSDVTPFSSSSREEESNGAAANGKEPIYNGGTWAFSGSFALVGGLNFELGKVWDSRDNSKWYFTFGPSLGFDLTFGILQKNIYDSPNFSVDHYQNYSSSYDIGILTFDAVIVGGDNYEDRYQSRLGATYGENGWGISVGSPIGVTWNSGRTIVW